MQKIELLSCMGCQWMCDQFTFPPRCPKCLGRFFRQVNPTRFLILKWILCHPRHTLKLFIQDIREKYHGNQERS